MTVEIDTDLRVVAAIEGLDRRLETGLTDVARVLQTVTQRQLDELLEQERRNAGFPSRADMGEAVSAVAGRVTHIEDHLTRARDGLAEKDDVTALGTRIDGLAQRIELLGENIAATAPRLGIAENAISELRTATVPRTEMAGLERRVHELSARVDVVDQGHTNRTAGLSTQINAWLVSLLLLIVGAAVSYALAGR
ncbi:MAG TPA: hypothetical protein VG815_01790 [Chloroflexota bacterium]|jgi:hypothetical protein|nr:hypothetical protein [Chloroflexota bacterium]